MAPLDHGNSPNHTREESAYIREQLTLTSQLQKVNHGDIVSLSERQMNTEKTANRLVTELQSVLSTMKTHQGRMASDEEIIQQRITSQQQEIRQAAQTSLGRDQILCIATQNALLETRAQVQHLTDTQTTVPPDCHMPGQDDRSLRANLRPIESLRRPIEIERSRNPLQAGYPSSVCLIQSRFLMQLHR